MTRRIAEKAAPHTVDSHTFDVAVELLRRRAGLLFPDSRHKTLQAAIVRVMRHSRLPDAAALVTALDDEAIFDDLVAEVTIGETYFFRESAQFDLIRTQILPELIASRPGRRIRAWSAACASGEEAYSLAITLFDQQVDGEVLGTDISRPRLRAAQDGIYRKWSLRGVPPATITRWFRRDNDTFTVAPNARQRTTFGYLNLADAGYPSLSTRAWGMDLILCRNVLIYFDAPTIERVTRALVHSLSADGWLLLGATDPPLNASAGVEVIETAAGLAYRRARPGPRRRTFADTMPVADVAHEPVPIGISPAPYDRVVTPAPIAMADLAESGTTHAPQQAVGIQRDHVQDAYMSRDYESVVSIIEAERAHSPPVAHRVLLVRALANLGRLADAGRACATALDAHRDVAELHYLHSILLMESGRPADAAIAAKRALYLDRRLIVAQLAAATAAARSGDNGGALRSLTAAERLLAALPLDAVVDASDGETAGRMLEMTRVQHRLISSRAP